MRYTPKQARQLAGLTQKNVADTLGVHVQTYMKWERNPEDMSVGTAKQFAKTVGIDFECIFFDQQSNLNRHETHNPSLS